MPPSRDDRERPRSVAPGGDRDGVAGDRGEGNAREEGPTKRRTPGGEAASGRTRGEGRGDRDRFPASGEFDLPATVRFVAGTGLFAAVARLSAYYGRDRSLWVFGARGGGAFVDNAKYLFLHVAERRPGIRAVWLSKDGRVVDRLRAAGYEAYRATSPRGVYYALRAGVVCLTEDFRDVALAPTGGANVVQLWHGIPLKRIGWDAELPDHPLPVRLCLGYLARAISVLVLTARELAGPFASGLRVDRDRMAVAGYPRTDALVREVPGEAVGIDDGILDRLDRAAAEGPLLFYLPTYREGSADGFGDHLDLPALERFLAERGAHLAVKPHPKESVDLGERTGSRVVEVPPDDDVYPLLRRADALVTDYSSVAFDFLLADRPVVFYPYDLDRYREERGFYFDYGEVTPGPTATEFGELLAALDGVLDGDGYEAERAALRDRFFECPAGEASERTCRLLEERFRPESGNGG